MIFVVFLCLCVTFLHGMSLIYTQNWTCPFFLHYLHNKKLKENSLSFHIFPSDPTYTELMFSFHLKCNLKRVLTSPVAPHSGWRFSHREKKVKKLTFPFSLAGQSSRDPVFDIRTIRFSLCFKLTRIILYNLLFASCDFFFAFTDLPLILHGAELQAKNRSSFCYFSFTRYDFFLFHVLRWVHDHASDAKFWRNYVELTVHSRYTQEKISSFHVKLLVNRKQQLDLLMLKAVYVLNRIEFGKKTWI